MRIPVYVVMFPKGNTRVVGTEQMAKTICKSNDGATYKRIVITSR